MTSANRTPALSGVLLAAALVTPSAAQSTAAACDPVMANYRADMETTVKLDGRDRASSHFHAADASDVIVLAHETGIDVTLEVATLDGTVARADSPIRRVGTQRLAFAPTAGADYKIDLIGKEHAGVNGRVALRILVFRRPASRNVCLELQRMLAVADSAYAAGQAVTRGTSTDASANAPDAYKSAARQYTAVAARLDASGPSVLLAQTQHALAAVLYQDVDDSAGAERWAAKAQESYKAIGDAYGNAKAAAIEAAALMELAISPPQRALSASGGTSQSKGEMFARARELLRSVAAFHAQRGELYDQALALNNIGLAYYNEGLNDEAIRAYRRALPLYEQLGDQLRQAQVLQNIAVAEAEVGRLAAAIARYAQVLHLITSSEYPKPYAIVLNNSALANWASGNIDAALKQYGEALELCRKLQDAYWQAQSLHGIGSVYDTIGDQALALEFYEQALALRSASMDGPGRTASLRAIANILRGRGEASESLRLDQEALSLASTATTVDRIRVQIAKDFAALGQSEQAFGQLQMVLSRAGGGDEMERAQASFERGRLRILKGDSVAAEVDLRSALSAFRKYEAPADEFAAWVELARLQRRRGAIEQAFVAVDRAMALVEEVRTQTANPELRATVMQPLRPAFDLKISMLAERYFASGAGGRDGLDQGVAMEALMTAEQARGRALVDFQNLDVSATGVTLQLAQQRQRLYRDLAGRRFQLENRLDGYGSGDARVTLLRGEIATLRQQLDRINVEMATASTSKRRDHAVKVGSRSIDLRAVPSDTAMVEYWLGADEAFAWGLTREQIIMRRIEPTSSVNDQARAFHTALRSFGSVATAERLKLGEQLYNSVARPLSTLITNHHTLIFAQDGALHYVPFAALNYSEGGRARFLVELHDIAVTPSITQLLAGDHQPQSPPPKQMLLVDDPVYGTDDGRLAATLDRKPARDKRDDSSTLTLLRGVSDRSPLPRLPGTAREAANIAALLPTGQVERLEGFTATRDRFLSAGLGQYRFIHVATHAVTDSEIPQLSALILSTADRQGGSIDGRVLAADIANTQLNADAVVLSACDTALGKNIAGEGLVGLRYVVIARGARSVMASLWQVPDRATADFMTRFYSALLRGHLTVVSASGAAMRGMIDGQTADPGLWAAFVLTVRDLGRH